MITPSKGESVMQIEIKIEAGCIEPRVIVITGKIDEEINALLRRLSEESPQMIAGFQEDTVRILDAEEIVSIYASNGKVYCRADSGTYTLRLRLYEAEERLDGKKFVRISNSEIINLHRVRGFDLSFTGTICVTMKDGSSTFVSRRYVSKIKQILGM